MRLPTREEVWEVLADVLSKIHENVPDSEPWVQTCARRVNALIENEEEARLSSEQKRVADALMELRMAIRAMHLTNWTDWERALDFIDRSFENGLTEVP
jgi:hypothetical protein